MNSRERGMNPVAMTIISPLKEYWPGRGSNQRPPVRYRLSSGVRMMMMMMMMMMVMIVMVDDDYNDGGDDENSKKNADDKIELMWLRRLDSSLTTLENIWKEDKMLNEHFLLFLRCLSVFA